MIEIVRRQPRQPAAPALSGMRQMMDRLFDDSLFAREGSRPALALARRSHGL
jgi:hypothetical protein